MRVAHVSSLLPPEAVRVAGPAPRAAALWREDPAVHLGSTVGLCASRGVKGEPALGPESTRKLPSCSVFNVIPLIL